MAVNIGNALSYASCATSLVTVVIGLLGVSRGMWRLEKRTLPWHRNICVHLYFCSVNLTGILKISTFPLFWSQGDLCLLALPVIGSEVRRLRLSQIEGGQRWVEGEEHPLTVAKDVMTLNQKCLLLFFPSFFSLSEFTHPARYNFKGFCSKGLDRRALHDHGWPIICGLVVVASCRATREAILRTPTSTPIGWTAIANGPTNGASSPNS